MMRHPPAMPHHRSYIAALLALGLPLGAQAQRLAGRWEGRITYDSLAIDFPCEWSGRGDKLALSFLNGDVRITSTRVVQTGDSLVVEFAHLASELRGVLKGGVFSGVYGNPRRKDFRRVEAGPVVARTEAARGAPNIGGVWFLPSETPKGELAWRFVVRQRGGGVTATILRVDGDAGALTGTWRGDRFVLSHFDGTRPSQMVIVPQADSTLAITLSGPRGNATRLVALRPELSRARGLAEPADFATHTRVRDPREPFHFAFPDVTGQVVADSDGRFRGKVVLVNVTGSWCPNCHDEAPYLAALYRKYRARGFEIVALDFEEKEQLEDLARLNAFVAKYGIEYAYLVAGEPAQVREKLPQAENLNTWPATFFLGRDGTVRAVRTGFAAKASGEFHDRAEREYAEIIEGLLRETKRP
jgi:thiol-disulfide isomerase/thioredoxin